MSDRMSGLVARSITVLASALCAKLLRANLRTPWAARVVGALGLELRMRGLTQGPLAGMETASWESHSRRCAGIRLLRPSLCKQSSELEF